MEQKQNKQEIQIKAADSDLKGAYANMAQIAHTREEFTLDFFNVTPPFGVLSSRVIVSPGHMKRLIAAMQENMKNYEAGYGEVLTAEGPDEFGFRITK